ncbi:hypothetical protein K493DRAFT_297320 [Basidiobolus meristosporus CBS 931.73]|uniref:RRM domain-containing protein n=1 Tax=Basidiobolus meristosporus CBS 931.73 TaxID=1314790 RepID=A0A1Y1Z094_9FUNG|nr:hypothetical protein K493DRAFT_297320 [Basidiobolus meristosporus CBS 931.73]|eukprot:ORY03701.1 hypothetical protein K493DRAFT_297320 [Basidiobolus meristosporus CBS 931.73]
MLAASTENSGRPEIYVRSTESATDRISECNIALAKPNRKPAARTKPGVSEPKTDSKVSTQGDSNLASSESLGCFSNFPTITSTLSGSKSDIFDQEPPIWKFDQKLRNCTLDSVNIDKKQVMNQPHPVNRSILSTTHNVNRSTFQSEFFGWSSCFSSKATRYISIGLLPHDIDARELKFLKNDGKIWHIYSDRIHDLGLLIVAYYDIRDAISIVQHLRTTRIRGEIVTVNYIRVSQLVKLPNLLKPFDGVNDFEGKLLLSYCPPNQFSSNMQLILEMCGTIREISQIPYKSDIVIEYYDIRHAVAAEEKLHRIDPHGTQIVVFHDYQDAGRSFAQHEYNRNSKCESISDIWNPKHPMNYKSYGKFWPAPIYTASDSQPASCAARFQDSLSNLLADPYLPMNMQTGMQFESRKANSFVRNRTKKPA